MTISNKWAALAFFTEAIIFQRDDDRISVAVVDLALADVADLGIGHGQRVRGSSCSGRMNVGIVICLACVVIVGLGKPADVHRRLLEVPCAFC